MLVCPKLSFLIASPHMVPTAHISTLLPIMSYVMIFHDDKIKNYYQVLDLPTLTCSTDVSSKSRSPHGLFLKAWSSLQTHPHSVAGLPKLPLSRQFLSWRIVSAGVSWLRRISAASSLNSVLGKSTDTSRAMQPA